MGRLRDPLLASRLNILSLAKQLKTARGEETLRDVARQMNLSASTLSRVENGCIPDLSAFLRICAWLKVNPANFIETNTPVEWQSPDSILHRVEQELISLGLDWQLVRAFTNIIRLMLPTREVSS
ncbi:MAG: helix-turn-helix domain-containing protein [Anaerolineae bacterium]|nr:helix-turn-helix domain-containing protein [Anaerolineae bacterium]